MKVALIYHNFLDSNTGLPRIGGVQTYIVNLCRLFLEQGWEPVVIQGSGEPFRTIHESTKVIGVPRRGRPERAMRLPLYKQALQELDARRDLIVFASEDLSVARGDLKSIAIQHGIGWDLPGKMLSQRTFLQRGLGAWIQRQRYLYQRARSFRRCKHVVCVDYNFPNWYRATFSEIDPEAVFVIPNFAPIASEQDVAARNTNSSAVKVLFARRFTEYRGARLMADVTEELLTSRKEALVTFAGEGPLEEELRQRFRHHDRVSITQFRADEAAKINLEHDIAVVPSLGSEGTSLSVAEAMGAGAAVVATAIGGITNMIIDRFNGRLVGTEQGCLVRALEELIADGEVRRALGWNGYRTAKTSLNLARWKTQWIEAIDRAMRG